MRNRSGLEDQPNRSDDVAEDLDSTPRQPPPSECQNQQDLVRAEMDYHFLSNFGWNQLDKAIVDYIDQVWSSQYRE
ncbi:hypothetical protein C1H46_002870 [Malus baccata]|uniref:Uncharacterized protein n=1 Tax=Malus baccata TaxID=106549 RepID=A0A540NKF1_MALBA|nr:hypothetical protein C1H46_002870 [Malus baccata]